MSAGTGTSDAEDRRRDINASSRYATQALDALSREITATRPEDRLVLKNTAAILARVSETYAIRDQARAMRELAASNDRLALSYDCLVEEMRARRGVPEAA